MTVTARPVLKYRIARKEDLPELKQLRIECGWGADIIETLWKDPYRIYCVYYLDNEDEIVGMGSWVLEKLEDPEQASRSTKTVFLASLFIRRKYQKQGLGDQAMDILETVSYDKHGAEYTTLDTAAHLISHENGEDVEHFDRPNPVIRWYEKRGYVKYRDNKPLFLSPTTLDPQRRLLAMFMRKPKPPKLVTTTE